MQYQAVDGRLPIASNDLFTPYGQRGVCRLFGAIVSIWVASGRHRPVSPASISHPTPPCVQSNLDEASR
jgi:hypothetical protein